MLSKKLLRIISCKFAMKYSILEILLTSCFRFGKILNVFQI